MKSQSLVRLDLVGLSLLALSCSSTVDGGSEDDGDDSMATGGNASTGGTDTGGASTGGQASGGAPTGGQVTGGASTGGQASGGAPTGGAATGGEPSTGGAGTGGDPGGTGGAQSDGPPYELGNPPVPSAGCNQSPTLSTGTHNMTSADLDREYILELPEDYDSSKPYRLIFGMHWFGGSAEAVQGWSEWFNLKPLDTEHSAIWVAPQGYTNGSPWRGDDKDHIFFEELYETLTSDLCVDTSRVFSLGFSFGAMFTNSLAQNHQSMLRGVVVYAAADYNIYFPENTGEPMAYMGVHGIDDPTCPLDSGRRSKDRFVENNGCEAPSAVPEAGQNGGYVVYDHECPSNYPVRWATFDGAHTYPPNDVKDSWVHPVAWEFITQF